MDDKNKVMAAVANVVDFVRQQIRVNLAEAVNQGKIELSRDQLEKVCFYAESSVTSSFVKASGQIENAIGK